MSTSYYPLVDLSDIPGCQSPTYPMNLRSASTSSRLTTSTATKSRLSSIFSMTSNLDTSDDDPFDLKASARKSRQKAPNRVNTGLLIDIDENFAGFKSPRNDSHMDWDELKLEAQALAGDLKGEIVPPEKKINFDEMFNKSPITGSPFMLTNDAHLMVGSSPENSPVKALNFHEYEVLITTCQLLVDLVSRQIDYIFHLFVDTSKLYFDCIYFYLQEPRKAVAKENFVQTSVQKLPEVYLDDQLERAIQTPIRKPLTNAVHLQEPRKAVAKENFVKTSVKKRPEVYLDDQLERAIQTPIRKPLTAVHNIIKGLFVC
jgi:hypothetical protein